MDNDPTDKNVKNPIIMDADADINTDVTDNTKRKRKNFEGMAWFYRA